MSVATSRRTQFVSLTARVAELVAANGWQDGVLTIFVPHTTAGMTINENADPVSLGTGTVEMSGTETQTISGQNIIQHFTVNNATGVNIGGTTTVNGILTLTSGRVSLGSNHLQLGPAATVAGTAPGSIMVTALDRRRTSRLMWPRILSLSSCWAPNCSVPLRWSTRT